MTVFGTVTASLSPSLSSYMRCKGKSWRAAFITSLETMAGVEYTVYKKKGLWQIKGDWENLKHAFKILTKVTKAADWEKCVEEGRKLQFEQRPEVPRAIPSRQSPRKGVAVGRQGTKRSTSFTGSYELTDTADDYGMDPYANSSGPMDPQFTVGTVKTEPDVTTETGQNKVNADGENALNSAIMDYAFELANESMLGSQAYSKTAGDEASTAKGTGIEPQMSEGQASGTSSELQSGQKSSSGSRRKRGRPRKLDVSTPTLDDSKESLEGQSGDDTEDIEDSAEFPMFTDSDHEVEASDPSEDQEVSIDNMVAEGKAKVKRRRRYKSYICGICKVSCTSQHGLTEHKKRAHVKKTLKCPICNKAYGVKRDLQKHIRRHTAQYRCEKCGKTYKEERTYKVHIKTHEEDYVAPRFYCKQCPKSFTTPYVLRAHVDQIHNGNRLEYLCTTCGKKFKQKHSLAEHNLIHTGERPYSCKICHKNFRHKASCVNHERLHSNLRLFTCEICGKDFKHRNSLRIHASIHDTTRHYECSICNKKFTQKQALVRHARIHSGEKPFMCELCGDRFSDSSILRRHMMGIHKTEYKPANNHFVLPADHFQEQTEGASPGNTLKPNQPNNPMGVAGVSEHFKSPGQETMKHLQQKGEQVVSNMPPASIPSSLSLEDYRVGHIASSMTSPYILQGALPYSFYPQSDRGSNSYTNLMSSSQVTNMAMAASRDTLYSEGSNSIKPGVNYHEQLLQPAGAAQGHHSGLQSNMEKSHTLQQPY